MAMSRARFETGPTHEDNDSEHNSDCCDYAGFPCANHSHSPIQGIRTIKYTNLTGTKSCPIFTLQALFCVPGDKKMRGATINGVKVGRLRAGKRGRHSRPALRERDQRGSVRLAYPCGEYIRIFQYIERLIALQRGRLYRTKHTVRCIKAEVFIRFQPNNLYRNRFVAAFPKA